MFCAAAAAAVSKQHPKPCVRRARSSTTSGTDDCTLRAKGLGRRRTQSTEQTLKGQGAEVFREEVSRAGASIRSSSYYAARVAAVCSRLIVVTRRRQRLRRNFVNEWYSRTARKRPRAFELLCVCIYFHLFLRAHSG
uniref:Uncharacterized protein n=1 Tax=Trichogramma kaykai TaxID=54128 RepID=A0ABD2W0X6_9HYME